MISIRNYLAGAGRSAEELLTKLARYLPEQTLRLECPGRAYPQNCELLTRAYSMDHGVERLGDLQDRCLSRGVTNLWEFLSNSGDCKQLFPVQQDHLVLGSHNFPGESHCAAQPLPNPNCECVCR